MSQKKVTPESNEISQPQLHDAELRGMLLTKGGSLLIPVKTVDGVRKCIALHGVERMRADDFRQGNTILDMSTQSGAAIEAGDVAYAYGVESKGQRFLLESINRLVQEQRIIVKINPSYGCVLVCICQRISVDEDMLP